MRKSLLALLSFTLVIGVLLVACSKSSSPPTSTSQPTASTSASPTTTTKPVATTLSGQTPKYGGTLNIATATDIATFDDANQGGPGGYPSVLFGQELWGGDW